MWIEFKISTIWTYYDALVTYIGINWCPASSIFDDGNNFTGQCPSCDTLYMYLKIKKKTTDNWILFKRN